MLKRVVLLLGMLSLLFVFILGSSNALALEKLEKIISQESAKDFATEYLTSVSKNSFADWENAYLEDAINLYDFEGNLVSYLFQVKVIRKDQGYIIISALPEFDGVLESTREGSNPYVDIKKGDAIYGGPLLHFSRIDNESVRDLNQGSIQSRLEMQQSSPLSKENLKRYFEVVDVTKDPIVKFNFGATADLKHTTNSVIHYSYKFISGVPDYAWYKGCSPTSGANIVKYWDNNGYPNLVASGKTTKQLISDLAISLKTNQSGGTSVSNMRTGMINYWKGKGYNPTVTTYSGSFSRFKTEIDAGRPNWVTTAGHSTYSDHAMTGVGYEEYYNVSNSKWYRQIIVHDTWNSTPVNVWLQWSSYFDYVIKVQP